MTILFKLKHFSDLDNLRKEIEIFRDGGLS